MVRFSLLVQGEAFAQGLGAGRVYGIMGPVTFLGQALGIVFALSLNLVKPLVAPRSSLRECNV